MKTIFSKHWLSAARHRWRQTPYAAGLILPAFAMLLLFLSSTGLLAQDAPAEQTYTLELDGSQPARVVVAAQAGETVSIAVRSVLPDEIDPTLAVLSPDNDLLLFNDDHGSSRSDLAQYDALIPRLTFPVSGDYTLVVNSFNGAQAGTVALSISPAAPLAVPVESDAADIVRLNITLPPGAVYEYSFSAAQGERLTITARDTSGTLDPRLTLLAPDSSTLAQNDDHNSFATALNTLDARIDALTLPADGSYTVRVTDFLGRAGSVELLLDRR